MDTDAISDLPIPLSIRLLLDRVSYSGALPEWFEPISIDYLARERTIRNLLSRYLTDAQPSQPYTIVMPKRDGGSNAWVVPTLDDQIVCMACIASIAETVERKAVDTSRVFSCKLNTDPDHLNFLEDQISAWARFKARTRELCSEDTCVLQIDLKNAFGTIGIADIGRFLDEMEVDSAVKGLLVKLLGAYSPSGKGLPFLNDSIFFLGNAYLSKVDEVVARHTRRFVRFADDYKIFGASQPQLEAQFVAIKHDLKEIGFEVNDKKVWLGTNAEYLDSASKLRYGATQTGGYVQDAVKEPGAVDSTDLMALVTLALEKPEENLHQGIGRGVMSAIRRTRVAGLFSDAKKYGPSPAAQFAGALSKNNDAIRKIVGLLNEYSQNATNEWRLVWLLYLSKDISLTDISDQSLRADLGGALSRIRNAAELSPVTRLWASAMPLYPSINAPLDRIEHLQGLDYVERGRQCYGSQK